MGVTNQIYMKIPTNRTKNEQRTGDPIRGDITSQKIIEPFHIIGFQIAIKFNIETTYLPSKK